MAPMKKPQKKSDYVSTLQEKFATLKHSGQVSPVKGDSIVAISHAAPLLATYDDRIRPLLDVVDKLRHLNIMQEGIQLPTIVVVGDQSSGKSSVLESLAGISLPRGQGICTRVPLIMRLENHSNPVPELLLAFHGKTLPTDESNVAESISSATKEIAGSGKGISHTPLTLIVKKKGVPDLTMVDLPGITRVPVHGQPEDIYEQISDIIMEYITPKESIILNVLSATVDFPTCESIRMSQQVDKTGERTLAVVTKADKAPEGLLEKVTADDVNIGLGYVCVRNRIGDESYEEARKEEAKLFASHPLLSKIDKSIVGIRILAQKLVEIQATSIAKCFPDIVKKINAKLNQNNSELNKMPRNLTNIAEAMTTCMQIVGNAKETLRNILIRGEFDEYQDDKSMHSTARMAELLNDYAKELQLKGELQKPVTDFLTEEIKVLEEAQGIGLPNFLPRSTFLTALRGKVNEVSDIPLNFVCELWDYIEKVVSRVLLDKASNFPQLLPCIRTAVEGLMAKSKSRSINQVGELVEMEKQIDYTCHPEYNSTWKSLMLKQEVFMQIMNDHSKPTNLELEGFGKVEVGHLRQHTLVVQQAFDLKMRMTAYWKIVLRRLIDSMALHLQFSVLNLVNKEMEEVIIYEIMGPKKSGVERMLQESPSVVTKREKLNRSIKLLMESKDVVSNVMDRIVAS